MRFSGLFLLFGDTEPRYCLLGAHKNIWQVDHLQLLFFWGRDSTRVNVAKNTDHAKAASMS